MKGITLTINEKKARFPFGVELNIKDRELYFPFGVGFLGECLENLDLSVLEIGEKLDKNPFKWIPTLMYESAKYGNGGELDFTKEDLISWIEKSGEDGNKYMNSFLMAFVESLTKNVPKQEGSKKKN